MQTSKNQKFDVVPIVKAVFCVLFFFVTVFAFAYVSKELLDNYMMLIIPTAKVLGMWVLWLCVDVLLVLLSLGIVSVLVRPKWIAILVSVFGAVLYALVCGGGMAIWIAAAVFAAVLIGYVFFVVTQLENQINFSIHPLGDKKMLVAMIMAVLVCVSLGAGYLADANKKNYAIPPEVMTKISAATSEQLKKTAGDQLATALQDKKLSKKQQDELKKQSATTIKDAEDKLKKSLDDAEKQLLPNKIYLAWALGAMLFFVLQMLFIFVVMLTAPLLALAFFFMKVTHFTKEESEKREVKWLAL